MKKKTITAQEQTSKPADGKSELNDGLCLKTLTWMRSSHYHCKKCRGEVEFLTRIPWKVNGGVKAIGICKECSMLLIEREDTWGLFTRQLLSWVKCA